ncbi:hypothetical protein ACIOVC_04220 [Pseudomonas neuropathica]
MKIDKLNSDELLAEKNLLSIYLTARRIPSSRFNTITTWGFLITLVIQVYFFPQAIETQVEIIRKYAEFGFNAALTTMGFLVAGFTIFATLSDPDLFIKMGQKLHPETKISWLKHNFFLFVRVFIYFMIFIFLCLAIMVFGSKSGLVSSLISLSDCPTKLRSVVAGAAHVALMTGFYFILMQLKSFIFNMHHAVMTSLKWKWDKKNNTSS